METESKKNWGGARKGSGRKKLDVKKYGFSAPPNVAQILDGISNKSAFICKAILHYAETQKDL